MSANFTLLGTEPAPDALREAALQRLEAEELQRIKANQEAAAERERGLVAQRNAQLAGAEATATRRLSALKEKYAARTTRAQAALAVLAQFAEIETQIREDEREIGAELSSFCRGLGMEPSVYRDRADAIWQKAGLPEHGELGLAEPKTTAETIARVALQAIARGVVGPGGVTVGSKTLPMNFTKST